MVTATVLIYSCKLTMRKARGLEWVANTKAMISQKAFAESTLLPNNDSTDEAEDAGQSRLRAIHGVKREDPLT